MAACRDQARAAEGRPINWIAAVIIVAIWVGLAAAAIILALRVIGK